MSTYIFDHVGPDTLAAYAAFNTSVPVEETLGLLAQRLADGRLRHDQLCQMCSGRGMEATWVNAEHRMVFPRVRADLPISGLEALARHLAETATASGKTIIVSEDMAPVSSAPWEAAGWRLDIHSVSATTELAGRTWPLDPRVQERPARFPNCWPLTCWNCTRR